MLKKHSQLFLSILMVLDLAWVAAAWFGLYFLRFDTKWFSDLVFDLTGELKPATRFPDHVKLLPVLLFSAHFCLRACSVYRPRREQSLAAETWDLAKASALTLLVTLAIGFFLYHETEYSRSFFAIFLAAMFALLTASHLGCRAILRRMRERGWNLRHVLVVGSGRLGQAVAQRFAANAWTGLRVVGFVDDDPARHGKVYAGAPVLGPLSGARAAIQEHGVDQVVCALEFEEHQKLRDVLDDLSTEIVDVRIVPDFLDFHALNFSVADFEGLPMISLREGPMYGWNRVLKRAFDVAVTLPILALLALPMLVIAAVIKLSSRGPVFYTQERMGLDGETFPMLKFRTMRVNAEAHTGPVWTTQNDPRRTRLGTFLRATSLDELPQFINVLRGQMSIVGPRPERPVFIHQFKNEIPKYMARHLMKAGITGWAQINGWRGNTSLQKRIQYDLYYIENWSLLFDLRIILLTPFKGLWGKNAY